MLLAGLWGGEEPGKSHANMELDISVSGTTSVGCYPAGASPYGALDMSGNAYEWTASQQRLYPYTACDGRNDPSKDSTWRQEPAGESPRKRSATPVSFPAPVSRRRGLVG